MAFDWKEYLSLARLLKLPQREALPREAALRSAVSRAYYAAHCHTRNRAEAEHGFEPTRTAEDHRRVPEFLEEKGADVAGNKLRQLKHWRERCDYDNDIVDIEFLAHAAVQQAEDVLDAVENLPKSV